MSCLFGAALLTFQLIRLALGGCRGFGFQSQPGTGLICSCCDFMLHGLKHKHTWVMIYGPWQLKLPPATACAYICGCRLSASGWYRANSFRGKTLQNIWMCWQDQACDWTTRPQMTGLLEGWATEGRETFPAQQQTQLHLKQQINFSTRGRVVHKMLLRHYPLFTHYYVTVKGTV